MYKRIVGFENYAVEENGTVINTVTNHIKTPCDNNRGYLYVDLYNGNKRKRKCIHRLVAEVFIPNPENKPYVNHIDGNTHNNSVENLEWCTPLENVEHASKIIKTMKQYKIANDRRKQKIKMIDKNRGWEVAIFTSIREAERSTCIPASNIVACLKGRQAYTKDYKWCYVEEL